MTGCTKRIPTGAIPKDALIAFVRDAMINDGCRGLASLLLASNTPRM
jgi:hypothetical protein